MFARYGEIHYIFCDSAEQTLINHIRTRLRACPLSWLADRVNNSAKIQIIDRIRLTSILMGGGRFWYMPEAPPCGMRLLRPCGARSTPVWMNVWTMEPPTLIHWMRSSIPSSAITGD